jgi:imidazoleglycerol phosphate dehydratase HisB
MRRSEISRETRETSVRVVLDLDGSGTCSIATGVPFFDHMLHAMGKHGRFDLTCEVQGDLEVDTHHTIEDTGIVLGDAIRKAIGEGSGIRRFAHAMVPMDESLATAALDCGGRGYLVYEGSFANKTVGGVEKEVYEHFFYSLCSRAGITAHLMFSGRNDHHQCEAVFKAFGIALRDATCIVIPGGGVPSTKGSID